MGAGQSQRVEKRKERGENKSPDRKRKGAVHEE